MASKPEPVLQVEQLFASGNPAIEQSLFDPSAPIHAGETIAQQPTMPAECAGQLTLTEEP